MSGSAGKAPKPNPVPRAMVRPKAVIKQEPGLPVPLAGSSVGGSGGASSSSSSSSGGGRGSGAGAGGPTSGGGFRGGRGGGRGGHGSSSSSGTWSKHPGLMPQLPAGVSPTFSHVKEERSGSVDMDAGGLIDDDGGAATALGAAAADEQRKALDQAGRLRRQAEEQLRLKREQAEEDLYEDTTASAAAKAEKAERPWPGVAQLWDMSQDALQPLRYPFVPHEFSRVDEGVLRHFLPKHGDAAWASLENDDAALRRHCVLFQLPTVLPMQELKSPEAEAPIELGAAGQVKKEPAAKDAAAAAATAAGSGVGGAGAKEPAKDGEEVEAPWVQRMGNPFAKVKNGVIGKLVVRKSGRAYLRLNGLKLDVTPGFNRSCVESFVSISADQKQFFNLAGVVGHVVVTPDIESMLAVTRSKDQRADAAN
jgi:hypothetical protein